MPVPILLYHHIDEAPPRGIPARSLWVKPQRFARQMQALKMLGFKGLSLRQAMPYIRGEKQGKVAVITFDDGAMSVYRHAMPVLDRLGFSATCFFVADYIGGHNGWDKPPRKQAALMGAAEMRDWAARGHEAGGHTLTHPHLPALPLEQAQREIIESKQKLEALFGFPLLSFAYPYGEENAAMRRFVGEAGYSYAVTTERGQAGADNAILALPRHSIRRNDTVIQFLLKCLFRKKG